MEPTPGLRPGWYADPAGGPQPRFWDGARWIPPLAPARSRGGWIWVVGAVAAIVLVVCIAPIVVLYASASGPSVGDMRKAADQLVLPPELVLVGEHSGGNRICLDVCVSFSREYAGPGANLATSEIFADALEKAGYRCDTSTRDTGPPNRCGRSVETLGYISYWQRAGHLSLSFSIIPIPSTMASSSLAGRRVDPAWRSFAILSVSRK
ncbi:DUF2510 domain-containing protein [Dactylosporangium sp. NPDC049140]|jgi:hypothetical protein|uniref:DUF2510 domain-containing protein n=1 Tax=Dactylosporangium sp. NPDC049140 TaxID=3155647 RepID=UPI00340025A4